MCHTDKGVVAQGLKVVLIIKAATGWSVFVSGVDLGRSRVLSGPADRR